MPESFDTMLAELADAAAAATVPLGLAEVRRRARRRTLNRRMSASALALVLVGLAGGAWAVVGHRSDTTTETVAPMAGQSAASAARSGQAVPPVSDGGPTTATAPPGEDALAFTGGAGAVVWKTSAQDGYLVVFSDGMVALSTAGSFALCGGRLAAASADATAGAQPLADVACDNFGTDAGLFAAPVSSGAQVVVSMPTSAAGAVTFSRVAAFSDARTSSAVAGAALLKQIVGTWISADAEKRSLAIGGDGLVSYTAYANTGKPYIGTGKIDADYLNGARAVFDCTAATATPCQVLLIEQTKKSADEITVYGSYGAEVFVRKG